MDQQFIERVIEALPATYERGRFRTMIDQLGLWRHLFQGKDVLDFGAGYGISGIALCTLGARRVIGVEPDAARVDSGNKLLSSLDLATRAQLVSVKDTTKLPFADGAFEFVLANAVLEHVPQPRDAHIRELWRLVGRHGVLFINETPNSYYPVDMHTTGLMFNHWLPRDIAMRRAIRRGRWPRPGESWESSGWRGLGYHEISRAIGGYRLLPELASFRHRLLARFGIPPSILDPYPVWIFQRL